MPNQLVKFPEKGAARAEIRKWLKQQPTPKGVKTVSRRLKAVPLTRKVLDQLRSIVETDEVDSPGTRPRGTRDLNTQKVVGAAYSALTTYEYMLLKAEYAKRRAQAGLSPLAQLAVQQQWRRVVLAAQQAFKAGGLTVSEAGINGYVTQLQANGANLGAVIRIRQSALTAGASVALTANTSVVAAIIPNVGVVAEALPTSSLIPGLCTQPIKQGSFTKHFGGSVALRVKITTWCPTWSNPFRTCTKTVTLATASYSLDINVGYKITCCGATAWGSANAQACAGVFGWSLCAGCTGTITGVAGLTRSVVGSQCQYGLGITATLKCTLAGITLLNLSYNFGWVVTGPCPPIPCP